MRKTWLALLAVALFVTPSCGLMDSDLVRVEGTVHHYDFEGGFWAIGGDDGTTYDPLGGVPADFAQEGLRVFLVAKLRPDMASFHMAGPIVEILTLRRL